MLSEYRFGQVETPIGYVQLALRLCLMTRSFSSYISSYISFGSMPLLTSDNFIPTNNRAFSLKVTYRSNCEFQVEESEAIMSSKFIDMDENYFTPTIVAHSQESVSQHIFVGIIIF